MPAASVVVVITVGEGGGGVLFADPAALNVASTMLQFVEALSVKPAVTACVEARFAASLAAREVPASCRPRR